MEKKETKEKKWVSILSYIVIIVLFIALLATIFLLKKDKINDDLVQKYYTYLGSNNLSLCDGLYVYDSVKITSNLVKNETKICNSYLNIESAKIEEIKLDLDAKKKYCTYQNLKFAADNYKEDYCTIKKFAPEDLSTIYDQIYNENLTEYTDFNIDENNVCHYVKDAYYCGLSENFVYSLVEKPQVYRAIKKTVEQDQIIYIYDLFLKVKGDKCYNNFNMAKEIDNCSKIVKKNGKIDYRILKKYGTLYRHTFKLNTETGKYYWFASQPEK